MNISQMQDLLRVFAVALGPTYGFYDSQSSGAGGTTTQHKIQPPVGETWILLTLNTGHNDADNATYQVKHRSQGQTADVLIIDGSVAAGSYPLFDDIGCTFFVVDNSNYIYIDWSALGNSKTTTCRVVYLKIKTEES